jgi:signal peptide peptidase SppA
MKSLLSKQTFAHQLDQEPLFLSPDFRPAGLILALTRAEMQDQEAYFTPDTKFAEGRSYRMRGNIAVIPVHGYLAHRDEGHIPGMYTGYDYITNLVDAALADDDVHGIVLDVDSPGGMVNGAFEASDAIRAAAQIKPVRAIVDASAYSAAYLLASAATDIVVPRTGGVGSIGVVTMHVDMSKYLEDQGFKVTMLYAGDQKVDGNPYEPLTADVKSRIESRLNQSYNLFVNTVADNRGMETDAVVSTQAGVFQGEAGKQIGLVDAVMPPSAAFTAFAQELVKRTGVNMSNENKSVEMAASEQTVDAAVEAKASERQRISAILGSDEAKGREAMANHLAFSTDMNVDAAIGMLKVAPKQEAPKASTEAAGTSFVDVMNNTEHPAVGSDDMAESGELDVVASIVSDYKRFTGRN